MVIAGNPIWQLQRVLTLICRHSDHESYGRNFTWEVAKLLVNTHILVADIHTRFNVSYGE